MEIIEKYNEGPKKRSLLYLAKPIYGGWVTFTAHLSKKYNYPIYKITKRTEKNKRDYGYECEYHNISFPDALKLDNVLITAVDKHYWRYLSAFPANTEIIIHDPTECKTTKEGNPLVQSIDGSKPLLGDFKIITIRESVMNYLFENFNYNSRFLKHPFYEYSKDSEEGLSYRNVSICRIDFDKNTDIILKANQLIKDKGKHIYCFGAENRIYVHHKLKQLGIDEYWKGKFPKDFDSKYDGKSILKNTRFVVDLSTIKNDGGGTQYTFLEAIYHNCILILHNDWINAGKTFQSGYNCLGVSNEQELSNIINNDIDIELYECILTNSQKLLSEHIQVDWSK